MICKLILLLLTSITLFPLRTNPREKFTDRDFLETSLHEKKELMRAVPTPTIPPAKSVATNRGTPCGTDPGTHRANGPREFLRSLLGEQKLPIDIEISGKQLNI